MGQYYKPISINKKQFVYSHDFGQGLKLMEHSYIGNDLVRAVEGLIAKNGKWHGDKIVWAGDYADNEKGKKNNLYLIISDDESNKIKPNIPTRKFKYLLNLDRKEFVDMEKVPVTGVYKDEQTGKEYEYRIHPLPLLTCEGNGRGGGDYHRENPLIGIWARDRITVDNRVPTGFKEIIFDLVE
jgi:hypothetical protein